MGDKYKSKCGEDQITGQVRIIGMGNVYIERIKLLFKYRVVPTTAGVEEIKEKSVRRVKVGCYQECREF